MENYDQLVEINHNSNSPYVPDHHCRIVITGGSGSGKTNVLLNLIKNQQILFTRQRSIRIKVTVINRREKVGIKKKKI